MKTGIELIAIERKEQIEKHYRLIKDDVKWNTDKELSKAALELLKDSPKIENMPFGWQTGTIKKAIIKPYIQRLIIAGALIAAEIDRLYNSKP